MLIGWVKHEGARADPFYPRSYVGNAFAKHDVRLAVEDNENFLLDVCVWWMRRMDRIQDRHVAGYEFHNGRCPAEETMGARFFAGVR